MATEIEAVEQLEAWVTEDRALAEAARQSSATAADQAEAIKWFSGAPDVEPAEAARMVAQAERLLEEGEADSAEGLEWDAAADGWQRIIDAIHEKAPSD